MTPFILLFVGLLLIFLEFYLPGGVMGTLGALTALASIIFFIMENDSPLYIFLFIVVTISLVAILIRFALWRIKSNKEFYSPYDQEGYVASHYDHEAIGKDGIVDTDLRPGGHVIVDGKRQSAISQSGYIPKGEKVTVIGGEGDTLKVKRREDS